jgi:hypothetical protein
MAEAEKEIRKQIQDPLAGSRGRLTGFVYLLYFLIAILSQAFQKKPFLYIGLNLLANSFYILLSLLFYYLFKPVNKAISLAAALFSVLGCLIGSVELFHTDIPEINPLLFFGPFCILIGCLIWRSYFLPGLLGIFMIGAGLGWLFFLFPQGKQFSIYIQILGILGEGILMLWLLIRGVDEGSWRRQAGVLETFPEVTPGQE